MLRLLRAIAVARQTLALLFVVLLVHATWMSGSAACESPQSHATQVQQVHDAHVAHAHRAHLHAPDAPDAPANHAPVPHDPTSTVGCPMAMACAVTAMISEVPSFDSTTVAVTRTVTLGGSDMPQSTRVAPETPPPRG